MPWGDLSQVCIFSPKAFFWSDHYTVSAKKEKFSFSSEDILAIP
jgi:hypothetical protein